MLIRVSVHQLHDEGMIEQLIEIADMCETDDALFELFDSF